MAGGDPIQASQADFSAQVRDALANLYDPVALSAHPLRRLLAASDALERSSPGGALRQQLATAIEDLKPGPEVDPNARPWRPYRVLHLRYIEWLEPKEVQRRLAISRSLYYREHESALAALVATLWDRDSARSETTDLHLVPAGAAERDRAADGETALDGTRRTAPASRLRAIGGFGLGMLAVISLLFVAQRAFPHSAGEKAGAGTSAGGGKRDAESTGAAVTSVTLSVFAGTGEAGYVNGPAASARFSGQLGMSIDSGGGVYVADTGNNRIRRIGTNQLVLDVAGSGVDGYADGPAATAKFSSPNALTVLPDGTIYVADAGNLRIRAISPAGIVSTLAGSGAKGYVDGVGASAEFTAAGAIAADSAGNVYVLDPNYSVIRKITPAGVVSTFAGNGKRGHVDGPPNIAEFNLPLRIGADSKGNIYVGDTGDSRVRKLIPAGAVSTVAGTGAFGYVDGPATQAQFSKDIRGICVDNFGNLYVIDAGNRRVRRVTPEGVVSTVFEFTDPNQTPANMKVDQAGNLYLSDREHNRIYKLTIAARR